MTHIVALSDMHGQLPSVMPPCDILLIVGDICPDFDGQGRTSGWLNLQSGAERQAEWLDGPFRAWLEAYPAKHIVGIAGNHDFVFENPSLLPDLPWIYLRDTEVVIDDLKIYGTPWVPNLPFWAFYADDATLRERYEAIPTDVDILMTHGPPGGTGDLVSRAGHVGSTSLTSQLRTRLAPKLHVFGHIHEGYGRWEEDGRITANVSFVDEFYLPVNLPMEFDIS